VSDAPVQLAPATAPAAVQEQPPQEKLAYRLITGPDDRTFCERISAALAEGYVLHGSPAATFNGTGTGTGVIVAQAVILPAAIASADAAVATAVEELDFDGEFPDDAFPGHA
jgi:hypothetical protein